MTKKMIDTEPFKYESESAVNSAIVALRKDDEWTYNPVKVGELYQIEVRDEENEFVGYF